MADQVAMKMDPRTLQSQKQTQRLIMLPQMQQAIQLLQVPIMELATLVALEMEQNPVLEYSEDHEEDSPFNREIDDDRGANEDKEMDFEQQNFEVLKQLDDDFRDHFAETENYGMRRTAEDEKRQTFLETIICEQETLFDHLMSQARESLAKPTDLQMAETLIGSLDENGYLGSDLSELAVLYSYDEEALTGILKVIQTFDPPGVAAVNLQESLLIQLATKGKQGGLAYAIVNRCYDDLLHNRIPSIAKNLGYSSDEVSRTIQQDVVKLDLHPGAYYSQVPVQHIVPDVTIKKEGDLLVVETNDEPIPQFRLNRRYMRMLEDPTLPSETADFIKQKITSARWLMRTIGQRNDTVLRIAQSLARRQADFFLHAEGNLVPLTMRTIADELELHESTIARAVSNKYLNSPRGLLPLRSFFTSALETEKGDDVSSTTARDLLRRIVEQEDKRKPLSDETISHLMTKHGIKCARRTIAKYRGELGYGNAQQRRTYLL